MGLGFVLLVWLAIAVAIALVWCFSLGIWLWGLRRRSRALAWLGGVPLVASSAAGAGWALFLVCAVCYAAFWILRDMMF